MKFSDRGKSIEMNSLPKVVIILVNYNGYKDTVECVQSLSNIDYDNYDIVIVENGSADKEQIKSDYNLNQCAHILYSDKNLGFSGGNNLGIEMAKTFNADYVLLLNNDTTVEKDFLSKLVELAQKEDSAITTGDIAFYSSPEKLWYSNGSYNFSTGKTKMVNDYQTEEGHNVSFSTGCLMLIKMSYIEIYGGLDDSYFLYSEDTDYCCKVIQNGQKIFWTPKSKIYHKISASASENSKFQQYYLIRNNLYIVKKYGKNKIFAYIYRFAHSIQQVIVGNYKLKPLFDAYKDFFKNVNGRSPKY